MFSGNQPAVISGCVNGRLPSRHAVFRCSRNKNPADMLRGLFLTDSIPRNSSPALTNIWETILTMFRTFPRIVAMQFLLMIYRLMVQKSFLKQLGNLAACTD